MNIFIHPPSFKLAFVFWLLVISGCGSISAQSELAPSEMEPVKPGDHVILVRSEGPKTYRENPLTANVSGAVLKVVETTTDGIVVKDHRGMAVVARKDLVLVRQKDPLEQIDQRVAAEHQPFAKAQLEDLRNVSSGFEALANVWDAQPSHDWCRLKIVEELLCFGERDQALDLLAGFQENSPAWPVAQAIKASLNETPASELTQIIEQNPKCFAAYQLLVNHHLDRVQQELQKEEFDKSRLKERCQLALGIIAQMEEELPERSEAATLRARLCSIAWMAEIPVAVNYSRETIRLGYRAIAQDPYDVVLTVELVTCLVANRKYDEAAQLALKAAKRFPRNIRPMQKLLTLAAGFPDDIHELPYSERTTEELLASDWQAIFNGIEKTFDLDIPLKQIADQAMPIWISNGNGRRESDVLLDTESNQSALGILCADDNAECLRFINSNTAGIDFTSLSEQQLIELVNVCVRNDSVHALKFLQEFNLLKRLPATARESVVQATIEQNAFGCALVLINSGWDLSAESLSDLANSLGCEKHNIESCLETKLIDCETDVAVRRMDRYSSQLANCREGLKLASEQIADIRGQQRHRQSDYYHIPAGPVFIPTQHVYNGTTEAEQGVRLRQAIQKDLESYRYPNDDDATKAFNQRFLNEAIAYRDNFNSSIVYFRRRISADSNRHLARLEIVVGKSLSEAWHGQLKQKLVE